MPSSCGVDIIVRYQKENNLICPIDDNKTRKGNKLGMKRETVLVEEGTVKFLFSIG